MKKIILSAIVACAAFGAGMNYTDVVKDVYADANSAKSIGRLLPTNAVEILQTSGDRAQIKVKGYQNPAVSNVVYFADGARIISVAFAKTAPFDIKVIKEGKNGKWNEVETTVFVQKDGFSADVNAMFAKADKMYKESCGVCHALPQTTHFNANQWPSLLKSMIGRTAIEKKDEWLVIEYLQKHSSDVNLGK